MVSSFCNAHNLPLSSGHLCELAEKNEWNTFLYEAETQFFPPEQVMHLTNYFTDVSLRGHLQVVLRNIVDEGKITEESRLPKVSESNVFQLFIAAQKTSNPSLHLLNLCVEGNQIGLL